MSSYIIQSGTLTDIANAIRSKAGTSSSIATEDMASSILAIPSGGGTSPVYTTLWTNSAPTTGYNGGETTINRSTCLNYDYIIVTSKWSTSSSYDSIINSNIFDPSLKGSINIGQTSFTNVAGKYNISLISRWLVVDGSTGYSGGGGLCVERGACFSINHSDNLCFCGTAYGVSGTATQNNNTFSIPLQVIGVTGDLGPLIEDQRQLGRNVFIC